MKLLLRTLPVLALLMLGLSNCGKESITTSTEQTTTVEAENNVTTLEAGSIIPIDNSQDCSVSMRVTISESGFSERHDHSIREILSGNQLWGGKVSSLDCGPSTFAYGNWYNIALVPNVSYQYNFVVRANCTNPVSGRNCTVTFKVGNKLYNYIVSTDEPLFFSKVGCGIAING
ncbi:MAG: hypothetical protein J0M29_18480 [Chitinophagales bacterium]|nr:hypothetical protein [Chitinophagales bacterium]